MGTYTDIPMHVDAAIRILRMRLWKRKETINRLFDRLAVESVLYQIFLVSTGLWTQRPGADYQFDAVFWHQAERLLGRSEFFPGSPTSLNSPVLGLPVSLFRLAIILRQQYGSGSAPDADVLRQIRDEVQDCEAFLLCEPEVGCQDDGCLLSDEEICYRDANFLYAAAISLLFEQLMTQDANSTGPPSPVSRDAWQVRKAIRILEQQQLSTAWSRYYIVNWPVYTIGLFLESRDDRAILQADLERRWCESKFAQIFRFLQDLESIWAQS